jgi:hypothetical protein
MTEITFVPSVSTSDAGGSGWSLSLLQPPSWLPPS